MSPGLPDASSRRPSRPHKWLFMNTHHPQTTPCNRRPPCQRATVRPIVSGGRPLAICFIRRRPRTISELHEAGVGAPVSPPSAAATSISTIFLCVSAHIVKQCIHPWALKGWLCWKTGQSQLSDGPGAAQVVQQVAAQIKSHTTGQPLWQVHLGGDKARFIRGNKSELEIHVSRAGAQREVHSRRGQETFQH